MQRKKRPLRLQWFALDVDAFLNDPRMRRLTPKERCYWMMICAKSFHTEGHICPDPDIIAGDTGATAKEAETLLLKLFNTGLLIGLNSVDAISNRMVSEAAIAKQAHNAASVKGFAGAEKRYGKKIRLE